MLAEKSCYSKFPSIVRPEAQPSSKTLLFRSLIPNIVLQVEEMVVFLHRTEPDLEFEGLLKRRHTQIKYLSVTTQLLLFLFKV